MASELRRAFHQQLVTLREQVVGVAGSVVDAVRMATDALLEGDTEVAHRLREVDVALDDRSHEIEREVIDLVALQAPVARELRFLLASQRIAQELQLSGHLATGIASRVTAMRDEVLDTDIRAVLYEMGAAATEITSRAVQAYETDDVELARSLAGGAAHVADMHRSLLRLLFSMDGEGGIEPIVELGLVARFYERIADHAEVIAERVVFISSPQTP